MRSSSGQASVEYVAALALLVLVFAGAGVAVAAPDVPRAVVGKLRDALCIVGGDVCSGAEAARRGLEPCLVSSEEHDRENGISFLAFHAGGSDFWSAERRSDGTVVLTEGYGQDADAGPSAGLHFGGAEAGGSVGAGVGFRSGRSWRLSEEKLKRLIAATKGDPTRARLLLEGVLGKPSTTFLEGGGHTGAELAVKAIRSIPGAGGEARAVLGRRRDGDGTTYYADLGSGSSSLVEGLDAGGHLAAEYRTGAPPTIALRSSGRHGATETETVMRLPLTDPADRALAERVAFVALHDPDLAIRDLVARIQDRGTVERRRYRTTEDASGWAYEIGLGLSLGADHATTARHRELIDAQVLNGALPARREDCVA